MLDHAPQRLAALALAISPLGAAQETLYTWDGIEAGDRLGWDVAGVGDVDQDGHPDVILGAPFHGDVAGLVWVRSGRTGKSLYRDTGQGPMGSVSYLGWSVGGGRDANADGVPDFVYGGTAGDYYNWGTATVVSGKSGKILQRSFGLANAFIGQAVLMVDDLDGDGGAEFLSDGGKGYLVWSSGTGAILQDVDGPPKVNFGWSFGNLDDLSGDGRGEIVVGAPNWSLGNTPGAVDVFDAQLEVSLLRVDGYAVGDEFGYAVAGLSDFDGDGEPDLLVGAPEAVSGEGRAYVLSGTDGALLATLTGGPDNDRFGASVDAGGDFDGDGVEDLLVGAPDSDDLTPGGGKVTVFSGAGGGVLATFLGEEPGGRLGFSAAFAGDLDLGGGDDVIAGAPLASNALLEQGRTLVYRAEPAAGTYCTAKLNSRHCLPRLTATGTASLANSDLRLGASQLINQQLAFAFWGTSGPAANPFGGGVRCVQNPVTRIPVWTGGSGTSGDCSGTALVPFDSTYLAAKGLAPGQTVYAQLWYVDPADPDGVGLTDAACFDVLP